MGSQLSNNTHNHIMKFLYSVLIGGIAVNAAPAVPAAFSGTKSASQQTIYDAASAISSDLDTNYATASAKAEGERTLWDNMWIALYDVFDAKYESQKAEIDSFSGYQKVYNKLFTVLTKINHSYDKSVSHHEKAQAHAAKLSSFVAMVAQKQADLLAAEQARA